VTALQTQSILSLLASAAICSFAHVEDFYFWSFFQPFLPWHAILMLWLLPQALFLHWNPQHALLGRGFSPHPEHEGCTRMVHGLVAVLCTDVGQLICTAHTLSLFIIHSVFRRANIPSVLISSLQTTAHVLHKICRYQTHHFATA
jgi:hypothetical protein